MLLPVVVTRLHVEDLHAVGWGEGRGTLEMVTPVKAIRVGVGGYIKLFELILFNA